MVKRHKGLIRSQTSMSYLIDTSFAYDTHTSYLIAMSFAHVTFGCHVIIHVIAGHIGLSHHLACHPLMLYSFATCARSLVRYSIARSICMSLAHAIFNCHVIMHVICSCRILLPRHYACYSLMLYSITIHTAPDI